MLFEEWPASVTVTFSVLPEDVVRTTVFLIVGIVRDTVSVVVDYFPLGVVTTTVTVLELTRGLSMTTVWVPPPEVLEVTSV